MTPFGEMTEEEFDDLIAHEEMTLDEYQDKATQFAVYGGGLLYATIGLASEAGEVAGKVKRLLRDDDIDFTADDVTEEIDYEQARAIASECGDTLWYLASVANEIGYSLEEIAEMNIAKLTDRKYRNTIHGSGDTR